MNPDDIAAGETSTAKVMGGGEDLTDRATVYIQYGAGGSWNNNVYTSAKAGTWTVTAVYGSLSATTQLTVNPGAATSLTLSPKTASITTAQTQTYTVVATDAQGNTWTPDVLDITWAEDGAGGFGGTMTYTPAPGGGAETVTITATVGTKTSDPATLNVVAVGGPTPLVLAWDKDTRMFYLCDDAGNPAAGIPLAVGANTVGGVTVTVTQASSTDLTATVTNGAAPPNSLRVLWYLRNGALDKCYSYSTISGTTHTAVYSAGRTSVDGRRAQVGFVGLAHNLNADPPTAITYSVVQQP